MRHNARTMYKVNFTPGPSQLYFTVHDHVKQAFKEDVPSCSHRSRQFEDIFQAATGNVRTLLNVPADWHIFFTGSATEIWERIGENLIDKKSFHFVNGSFSKRFHEIASQLNKEALQHEAAPGKPFDTSVAVPADTSLIALTHNETSTGVTTPLEFIHSFRTSHPNAIVAVDAVSSLPYPQFDYDKIDTVFFSVQKGFGLPAGLGVWLVNERCIGRSIAMQQSGVNIGTYHNLPTLKSFASKNQTPETPNVLAICLLAKVTDDMIRRGIHMVRKETEYKAAILYQALEANSLIKPFVDDPAIRSKTVIVADCGGHLEKVRTALVEHGLHPGEGYGPFKKQHLRFANFPTHSKEQFECLVDILEKIR